MVLGARFASLNLSGPRCSSSRAPASQIRTSPEDGYPVHHRPLARGVSFGVVINLRETRILAGIGGDSSGEGTFEEKCGGQRLLSFVLSADLAVIRSVATYIGPRKIATTRL